jgi:phosphate transport system protein
MSADVIRMVNDSITAFVQRDLGLAREIIAYDDVVDDLFDRIKGELISAIAEDAANGAIWLDMLMVAKYLERIGDHATNVAEWAEYAITGKRSKNGKLE